MLGEMHDIFHEFPEFKDKIEHLKASLPGFSDLMAEHDELDDKIRDLELAEQPVGDEYMEDLKKQRVVLKDKLYEMLKQAAS